MTTQQAFVATLFDDRSNPGKVTVAVMMAMNAARKGHRATLVLMVEAVKLAVPGGVEGIDIGAPFKPVKELLETFLSLGGKVVACASCLEHNHLTREQLDPRVGVVTAPEVIDLLMGAQGSLQVT